MSFLHGLAWCTPDPLALWPFLKLVCPHINCDNDMCFFPENPVERALRLEMGLEKKAEEKGGGMLLRWLSHGPGS